MGIFFFWFCLLATIALVVFYKFLRNTPIGQFLHKYDDTWWAVLGNITVMFFIIVSIVCFYFFIYLPSATNHGQVIYVPDLHGKKIHEVESELSALKLNYVINETTWVETQKPNTVISQNPSPKSEVKEGRKIYLTINSNKAPDIEITAETATRINQGYKYDVIQYLKNLRFKVTTRTEKSPYLDYVLRSEYRARQIKVGDRIPQGATIEVFVGDGKEIVEEEPIIDSVLEETEYLDEDEFGFMD